MPKQQNPLDAIYFKVKKVPVSEVLPKGSKLSFTNSMNHLIVVDTPTGEMAVNSCSENYELIDNKTLLNPLIDAIGKEFNVKVKASHRNYSKFFVDLIMLDKAMSVMKKDTLHPRIRIINSYDGSIRYQYSYGLYRVVCSNGLAILEGNTYTGAKMMHTSQVSGPRAYDRTLEDISAFMKEAPSLIGDYKDLADKKLLWEQALQRIEDAAQATSFPKKQKEAAVQRLEKEKQMGFPLNDYLVYNAMNFALHNSDTSQPEHKRDKVDLQVLNFFIENK